jgi:hypothetical protein
MPLAMGMYTEALVKSSGTPMLEGLFLSNICACEQAMGRGLHSSTFWLNVRALSGIGAVFRGCVGGVYAVSGGVCGVFCVRNGSG